MIMEDKKALYGTIAKEKTDHTFYTKEPIDNMWKLYNTMIKIIYFLFGMFPIKKNKIVISSYLGLGYGDNAKYIVEELLSRGNAYDIVWLSKNRQDTFPSGIRQVPYKSIKSIYEQCTALIWIDNRRKPYYVRKRKKQVYFNTWHGYMGIKRLEQDVEEQLGKLYVQEAKHDSHMVNYFISGSEWETKCIARAFWYNGTILKCGYPRSDILIHGFNSQKVKNQFGIDEETKILLYAPTFRKSLDEESLKKYQLEWNAVLHTLQQKFGGNWVGMIRLHPNLIEISDKIKIPPDVINVTSYGDMQELIATCDCLITDYSSTVMDAGVANKIGFIYATDFSDYQKERDVYFDIKEDLPFAFSESTEELINNIKSFDQDLYSKAIKEFFDDTYGVYRSGKASSYVCDLIDKHISGLLQ